MELEHLLHIASENKYDRKIRMFSIACLRRVSGTYNREVLEFLDLAEQVFDLETRTIRELQQAAEVPEIMIYKAPFQLARHDAATSAIGVLEGIILDTGMDCHGCIDLFYEMMSNGGPTQVRPEIRRLAQHVYDTGLDADSLANALGIEHYSRHLRSRTHHPRGCWVLDTLLGKRK